jgi:hypothetical protein
VPGARCQLFQPWKLRVFLRYQVDDIDGNDVGREIDIGRDKARWIY